MAFPVGVSVAIIEAGRAFTSVGSDVSMSAKVTPIFRAAGGSAMKRIVHAATGHPMLASTEEFKAEAGSVLSFAVPHVDQPGWQAPSGEAYTMWYYAVEITARVGNGRNSTGHVWKQNVQPLVGQDFIDLDLIADGPTGEPVTAPQAYVTDVEGQTGSVQIGPIVGVAIDQAVADGRIPTPQVDVTEIEPGVYDLGTGDPIYGLTSARELPSPAVAQLDVRYAEAAAVEAARAEAVTESTDYADAIGTGIRTDLTPSNSARPVGKGELVVNVRDYGAVGDGVTDDTAAFQAFVNDITVNSKNGYIPKGRYRVSATINFPVRPGWSIQGAGRDIAIITQAADNVPIFDLGAVAGSALHTYSMQGLTFEYATAQPETNTNAVCVVWSVESFQAVFRDINFNNGYYGMRVRPGIGAPWGVTFDDLVFRSGLTGGAMDWSQAVNGVPNNRFGRLYADAILMTSTVFHIRGYNFQVDVIEVIRANKGAQIFNLAPGGSVEIGSLKLENGVYAASRDLFFFGINTYARIGHLTITGHTMQFTGGTSHIVATGSGSKVEIGLINLTPSLVNVGQVFALAGSGEILVSKYTAGALASGLVNQGSQPIGEMATVLGHVNGRMSQNKGDANYTVALGDPNKVMFQTPFTAPRTITLPSVNNNLFNGLYYEFIFQGAINGANTAAIVCDTVTKHTQATDKAVVGFTYRRNAVRARDGWVLTKYETLP